MATDLAAQLPVLGPRAVEWAVGLSTVAHSQGSPLIPELIALARKVGVKRPENIRLIRVEQIPLPTDPELANAANQVGLAESDMAGLTLGYVVFLRRGIEPDTRLFSHEFRHVAQYEACGGIPNFLFAHLNHLVAFGYHDSPFEVDARAHEMHAA
jgi:hypothetical protein